jgi:CelD/BcsL family acetyltransferase involved in cellulose biosynthesis
MNAIVIDHADPAHALTRQWAALSATTPFYSWEVFKAWHAMRRPGEEPFVILISDEQGRLAAVAPWCIVRDRSGVRKLTGIAGEDAWYHDPWIVRPELNDAIGQTLSRTLHSHARSWDKMGLILRKGQADAFRRSIRELGLTYEERVDWRQHLGVTFGEAWADYWESRPSALKTTVQRKRKRLNATAHRFYVAPPEAAEAHWEALFEMQATRMPDERDWKTYHAVLRAFCLAAHRQGSLRIYGLEIEGRLAAVILYVLSETHVFDLNRAIDESFSQYSPGSLLTHWALEHLHQEGMRSLDPGPGNHTWKQLLTTGAREPIPIETVHLHAASPRSLRGTAEFAWSGMLIPRLKSNPILRQIRHALKAPIRRFQPAP